MEAPPLTAAERISRLIEHLEMTAYQFGKETGLSHQTISNVLGGKNKPSLDTLEAIARRYPQAADWLLLGTGPLLREGRAVLTVAGEAKMPEQVERRVRTPTMLVVPDLSHLSAEDQATYWQTRWEKVACELAELTAEREHEETVQLLRSTGGRSFSEASAEAADSDEPLPRMVALSNPDYREPERVAAGFKFGVAALV